VKKINLKGISDVLSEKEMKNIMGGSGVCPSDKPWPIRCANGDLRCYPSSSHTC